MLLGVVAALGTACGKDDGTAASASSSMTATTSMTASGGPGSSGPLLDTGVQDASLDGAESCNSTCCADDVRFFVEDGRTTFTLTLELGGGSTTDATLRCPDGPHETRPDWTVTCEGAAVRVDSDGTDLGGENNGVRLEGGPRQTWGAELEFGDCDCNCQPREGSVVVLLDPTGATSSGSESGTGETGGTTTGPSTSSGSSG